MITTNRNQFTGMHLTPDVKEALRNEARLRRISMSELGYLFIAEKLAQLGHMLPEFKNKAEVK